METIPALLERQAERRCDTILVRCGDVERSYAATRDLAARIAGALREGGIGPGDRVAVVSENRIEVLDLWLGCAWLGAVLVPVNTALRGKQLAHVLRTAAPEGDVPRLVPRSRRPRPSPPAPGTRPRSSSPPARPGRRRASSARTGSGTGGVS